MNKRKILNTYIHHIIHHTIMMTKYEVMNNSNKKTTKGLREEIKKGLNKCDIIDNLAYKLNVKSGLIYRLKSIFE